MSDEKNRQSTVVTILILIIALIGIIVIGWSVSTVVSDVIAWLVGLDDKVTVAALAASATVIASVLAVLFAQRSIKKREISEAHRAEKTDLYSGFINKIVEILKKQKNNEGGNLQLLTDDELLNYFYDFHERLVLWGSSGTIRAYHKFRQLSVSIETSKDVSSKEIILLVDDIFKEMRKDLGGNTRFLRRGSLIRLFLNEDIPD